MDRSRLSNIETGTNENPELTTLRSIATALQVDIAELFIEPRPEQKPGHGQPAEAAVEPHSILAALLEAADVEMPAEDSWRGDVLKAVAVLNRALRRPNSGTADGSAANTRR